jgi:hypothetical protein
VLLDSSLSTATPANWQSPPEPAPVQEKNWGAAICQPRTSQFLCGFQANGEDADPADRRDSTPPAGAGPCRTGNAAVIIRAQGERRAAAWVRGRGWSNVTVVIRPQAGTISEGRRVVIIRAIVLRNSRKAVVALIAALLLSLHGPVVCAAGVPDCGRSSFRTPPRQEQGCHHQHNGSRQGHGCACCDSTLCEPCAELTRPGTRSTVERGIFVALSMATRALNSAARNLPGVSEPTLLHSRVRVFLLQRTLLI